MIHYLKNDPGPQVVQTENDNVPTSFGVNNNYVPLPVDNLDDDTTSTLALGYNVIDVQDEESEGKYFFFLKKIVCMDHCSHILCIYAAIARLGVYQLGLSATEYLPLLKFALNTNTLSDSCAIIILDWTRPWLFLESLQRWMHVLQHRINEIRKDGSAGETWSKGKAIVDELREKGKETKKVATIKIHTNTRAVENYLQTYTEPTAANPVSITTSTSTGSVPSTPISATNPSFSNSTSTATPLVTTTTSADKVTLPLSQGTLTNNVGIPIVIVCCKVIKRIDDITNHENLYYMTIRAMRWTCLIKQWTTVMSTLISFSRCYVACA